MSIVEDWLERRKNHWFKLKDSEELTVCSVFGCTYWRDDRWEISLIIDNVWMEIIVEKTDSPARDIQSIKNRLNKELGNRYEPWRPWWKSIKGLPKLITAKLMSKNLEKIVSDKKWFYLNEKRIVKGRVEYIPNEGVFIVIEGEKHNLSKLKNYSFAWFEDIPKCSIVCKTDWEDDIPF